MFFSLIIAAGSETTRNSIAVGMLALTERPDALEKLRNDRSLLPNAVEEILRWASSTPYNRRTATRDVEIGGQQIKAGNKVTLWWASANRDEAVFTDPSRFDIVPKPEPALGLRSRHALLPGCGAGAHGDTRGARCASRPGRRGGVDRPGRVRSEQQARRRTSHAGAPHATLVEIIRLVHQPHRRLAIGVELRDRQRRQVQMQPVQNARSGLQRQLQHRLDRRHVRDHEQRSRRRTRR